VRRPRDRARILISGGTGTITKDDFDSIGFAVIAERLVVWTVAGTREVKLPHAMTEALGSCWSKG
jgi:hypothetical protein